MTYRDVYTKIAGDFITVDDSLKKALSAVGDRRTAPSTAFLDYVNKQEKPRTGVNGLGFGVNPQSQATPQKTYGLKRPLNVALMNLIESRHPYEDAELTDHQKQALAAAGMDETDLTSQERKYLSEGKMIDPRSMGQVILPALLRKKGLYNYVGGEQGWNEYQTPGVNINVPFMGQRRLDVKGVADFAVSAALDPLMYSGVPVSLGAGPAAAGTKTALKGFTRGMERAAERQAVKQGVREVVEGEAGAVGKNVNKAAELDKRIANLTETLSKPGRLASGTRREAELELARLEAAKKLQTSNPENIDLLIQEAQRELNNRSVGYHAGAKENLFPEYNKYQLDTYETTLREGRAKLSKAVPEMAPSTSVQTGIPGIGEETAQSQMFGEVSGKASAKQPLIDADVIRAQQAAKPLPGQSPLPEGAPPVKPPVPSVAQAASEVSKPFNGVEISSFPELQLRALNQVIPGKAQRVLQKPVINQAGRIVNPLAVAGHEPGTQLSAMSGMIDDQIEGGLRHAMAKANALWRSGEKLFVTDRNGVSLAKNIKQTKPLPNGAESMAMHDLIEYAPWYDFGAGKVGNDRRAFIEEARNVSNQMSAMLRNENILVDAAPGVSIKPGQVRALTGENGWAFLHRVVNEVKEDAAGSLARNLGRQLTKENTAFAKAANESDYGYLARFAQAAKEGKVTPSPEVDKLLDQFAQLADVKVKKTVLNAKRNWATVAEGMKSGVTYESNPIIELNKQVRASYELVKKKRLAEAVKVILETTTPKEKAISELGMTIEQVAGIEGRLAKAEQLQTVLNRAVRGERLPGATLSSLEKSFPDETQELKALIARWQEQPIPETAAEVQALDSRIKALINNARNELQPVTAMEAKYAERMGSTGTTEYGKVIGLPGMGNRVIVPQMGKSGQEIADELRRHFGYMKNANEAIDVAGKIGAVQRMGKLAYDISTLFIQQAMSLGYDIKNLASGKPTATWGRTTGGVVKTLTSKEMTHLEDFIVKNSDVVKDFIQRGGLVETAEFTEGADILRKMLAKAPEGKIGNAAGFIAKHILGRSDAVFTTGRVETAINLYKAGFKAAEKAGMLDEWARMSNKMSGVVSSRAMGISPNQRSLESAFGFMSPRFTRANAAIVWDIVTNPKSYTSKQAAQSLTALIGAMTAAYLTINKGQGKDVTLNPFNPDFGKIEIGNRKYYLGGIIADLRRLLQDIDAATYYATGRNISLSGKEDNTPNLAMLAVSQGISKSAPTTSTLANIAKLWGNPNAKDYDGKPLTLAGIFGGWGYPSFTEGMINQEKDALAGSFAEWLGLTSLEIDRPYQLSLKWKDDFKDYNAIPTDPMEVKAKSLVSREKYRENNPLIDAKLFIAGEVSTVRTDDAAKVVMQLVAENKIDPKTIKGVEANLKAQEKLKSLGMIDDNLTPTDTLVKGLLAAQGTKTTASPITTTPSSQTDVNSGSATPQGVTNVPSNQVNAAEPTTTATTTPQSYSWDGLKSKVRSDNSMLVLLAFNKVWNTGEALTSQEDAALKDLFAKYPMGQTNYNVWLKQTTRQLWEKSQTPR
ncbi:MAG: hypothetical protein WC455_15665 [Dehalococcoidia bacterium]|jgi:hypothetical protein